MGNYITDTYALKYYGECCNYRKQRSRIEIWQKGAVNSTYPRKIGDITALSLAINGNEAIDAPIIKTILNLSMVDTWDEPQEAAAYKTKHGVWEEFYTPDSTAYLVKLFTAEEGDVDWLHRWSGYITPDNWKESVAYRGAVSIVARDNFGHLQDFDFDLPGNGDGLVSAYDIIVGALTKIAFPMNVVIGTAGEGSRANLLETDAAAGSRGIFDAMVAVSSFEGSDWGSALEDVMDSLGLTARFVDNNTVVITPIRNLPLCGATQTPPSQTIEFYGGGTRMLVPAYKDVKIVTNFDYERDVTFSAKVNGEYGSNESFHWQYFNERAQRTETGDALRCDVSQTGRGWFSNAKAFVNPRSYFIVQRGGGAAIVDTDTTALLIANASREEVANAEAGYIFGKVNTPAAVVSLNVTASFVLSGRYLLRSGSLQSYEWAACYIKGSSVYWWNGSQWKNTVTWKETTENKMDFSAPMNLQDIPTNGTLHVFVRNIKATTGFCIGVDGVVLSCNDPSSSLKGDEVTVINNSAFNVRAKRTPAYGFMSKSVVWNVVGNYPNAFWHYDANGDLEPFPYQQIWSDGTEKLGFPVQWAKQTLMFHHTTLQQLEGEVGVVNMGLWRFDRTAYYKGHLFLPQGGTYDLLTGHVVGLSLREYISYETLWEGAATVAPLTASFPQTGGSASFVITCAEDKSWTVDGLPDWLRASVQGGTGSGTVTLYADVNDYGRRIRTIYIAGVAISVVQDQRSFDLSATPAAIEKNADGGSTYLTIAASNDSTWRVVVSDESWILVNGLGEWEGVGYDDALLTYVQANETGAARSGSIELYDGEGTLVQTIPVNQSADSGGGGDLTLTITSNVDAPNIALTIDGAAAAYSAGMPVRSGATVAVVVSKAGYTSVSDSFVMSAATTSRFYTLSASADATITPVFAEITQPAQNLQYTISDPSNHGWTLEWDGPDSYGEITGGGVISGNATYHRGYISGTGNAVVYLSIPANTSRSTRSIDTSPFRFSDENTGARTALTINQLGTEDSAVLVTGISLNKTSMALNTGASETLTATVSPSNATNKNLSWASSNSSVAQVGQDGTVYAVGAGSCTITASATDGSGKTATCYVSVTGSQVSVTGVSLNKSSLVVGIGMTAQLLATVAPSNATNKAVTWRSSESTIASVDSDGLVTGVRKGACRIYVKTADGGYEAYCSVNVTANGSMSADNINIKSVASSASAALQATNMNPSTIVASESASWLSEITVDTSSYPYRVRMKVTQNTSATGRQATVTVTGKDLAGDTVTTSFDVYQNGRSSGDVPCEGMSMSGPDSIYNSDNLADYSIDFTPVTTTQNKVVWSVTDRSGNATSYARIETEQDDRCSVKVLSGANATPLLVKAVNYYNGQLVATKEITATYIGGSTTEGHIEISESYIEVAASATQDNWAQVSLVDMSTPLNQLQIATSGFITSAAIDSAGRLNVVFPANNNDAARDGSVTLTGTNNQGHVVTAVVSYLQRGKAQGTFGYEVEALQIVTTTAAKLAVTYHNDTYDDVVIRNLSWSIVGYNSSGGVICRSSGTFNDKTVAALTSETDEIDIPVEITGPGVRYVVTLTSSNAATATYEGDGTDPI